MVRLKGGDPFVLGRGGEEVLAFRNASPDVAITVPLRVSEDVAYVIEAAGQPTVRLLGRELCTTGLRLECPLLSSAWVTVRVAEGSAG